MSKAKQYCPDCKRPRRRGGPCPACRERRRALLAIHNRYCGGPTEAAVRAPLVAKYAAIVAAGGRIFEAVTQRTTEVA